MCIYAHELVSMSKGGYFGRGHFQLVAEVRSHPRELDLGSSK